MRSIDNRFYKRKAWMECQSTYMESVNRLCERCAKEGKIVPAKIVHHKIHLNAENVNDPAIAYGFDNLEAVCLDCHNTIHFGKSEPKRYQIIDGELIMLE